MKVRSYLPGLAVLLLLTVCNGHAATVDHGNNKAAVTEKVEGPKIATKERSARIAEMKARIKEIRSMDKSQLSKEERKELRQEMKNMRKEAREKRYTEVTFIFISGCLCTAAFFMFVFV
ncbi:MAG TPA: hypothetical protein VI461_11720 [Chitinophagaceae bacterium]|nr:hypothetical protein [Chitinophagaceae bacterium]